MLSFIDFPLNVISPCSVIIIIIIIIILLFWEIFTPELAYGFSFEWQQVFSSFQDSSQYSSRS